MSKIAEYKLFFLLILIEFSVSLSHGQSFELSSDALTPLYDGKIEWADLDNDNDLDIICNGFTQDANAYYTKVYENVNGSFVSRSTGLPNIRNGTFALGDFDKDGDLDVLLCGLSTGGNISALYENTGAFSFSLKYSLSGLINATASWFDIDNDEDIDLLIAGTDDVSAGMESKLLVYENIGNGFNLINNTNLPTCSQCAMDWADGNGDGAIDLIISGFGEDFQGNTSIYLNNRDKTFVKSKSIFRQLSNGDARWGDFDNDGDMDVLLSGTQQDGTIVTLVYENKNGEFQERTDIQIQSVGENWFGGTKWLDYNNDGLLDILVSGRGTSVVVLEYVFKLYKNKGDGTFEEVSEMNFAGIADSSVDFGDFDNDGDVDICFSGISPSGPKTGIYKNKLLNGLMAANSKPSSPAVGSFVEKKFFRKQVTLTWGSGNDTQTPSDGLSYNFYLQHNSSKVTMPSVNFTSGYLLTANPPNGHGKSAIVDNLQEGNNAWAVQSIDGCKSGSLFSAERTFYQINGPESVKTEIMDAANVKLNWLDNSSIETSYHVIRSTNPISGFSALATLPQNSTSYTDNYTFLTDTYYYYRIDASNSTKTSAYDSLKVLIPTSPSNLQAQSINASKINLTWLDHSNYETGYEVERKLSSEPGFTLVTTLGSNSQSYSDSGLSNGTSYDYRVRAINEYGGSVFSNTFSAQTNFKPVGSNVVKDMLEDDTLTFTSKDFKDKFSDTNTSDTLNSIVISALPQIGILKLNNTPVTVGQTITSPVLKNLRYIPSPNDNGQIQFSFYYSDGKDNSAVPYAVKITIISVNDFPAFDITDSLNVLEDFANQLKLIPKPAPVPKDELSQTVTYSIQPATSDKVTIIFNQATGELKLTSVLNQFGKLEFVITANDGQDANNKFSKIVKLIIQPVDDAPVLSSIPDQQIELNVEGPINFMVSDVDTPIDSVILSVKSDNQALVKNEKISIQGNSQNRSLQILPEKNAIGNATITVTASDGKRTSSVQFGFKVISITEVSESIDQLIQIYPNPVVSSLVVSMNEVEHSPCTLAIHDVLGRQVLSELIGNGESVVHLSGLSAGIYVLSVTGNSEKVLFRKKVIKN